MSKKVVANDNLKSELSKSAFFTKRAEPVVEETKVEPVQTVSDITERYQEMISEDDIMISPKTKPKESDNSDLAKIIHSICAVSSTQESILLRMTSKEKTDIEDYIYKTLMGRGVKPAKMSINRLMRICTRYMIKSHGKELADLISTEMNNKDELIN